jgi:hypothetical protein
MSPSYFIVPSLVISFVLQSFTFPSLVFSFLLLSCSILAFLPFTFCFFSTVHSFFLIFSSSYHPFYLHSLFSYCPSFIYSSCAFLPSFPSVLFPFFCPVFFYVEQKKQK